jgi:hypothetical protein
LIGELIFCVGQMSVEYWASTSNGGVFVTDVERGFTINSARVIFDLDSCALSNIFNSSILAIWYPKKAWGNQGTG